MQLSNLHNGFHRLIVRFKYKLIRSLSDIRGGLLNFIPCCPHQKHLLLGEVGHDEKDLSPAICQVRFPQWPWGISCSAFPWKPKLPNKLEPPTKWRGSHTEWTNLVKFLKGLRWSVDPGLSISFCELALLFHLRNFQIDGDQEQVTLYDIYKLLRDSMLFLSKLDTPSFSGSVPFDETTFLRQSLSTRVH